MNRNRNITKNNFAAGMRRDAALAEEPQAYLRSIKNFKIDYVDGALEVRKGYTRWNTTALADYAYQLYHFVDMSWNEHLLAIIGTSIASRWYVLSETGSHLIIKDETAVSPDSNGCRKPIITWNNRCFFGTNYGWYWTDDTALGGATKCYQAGIDPPSLGPGLETIAVPKVIQTPDSGSTVRLNTDSKRKIAIMFTTTYEAVVNSVSIKMRRAGPRQDLSGSVKISIYTNSGGLPSALVDAYADSDWRSVSHINYHTLDVYDWINFYLKNSITLDASTSYWIIIEGDDAYYEHYRMNPEDDPYLYFALEVAHYVPPPALTYNYWYVWDTTLTPDAWDAGNGECIFFIGDYQDVAKTYDYIMTYCNSTYGIESRPSHYQRIRLSDYATAVHIHKYAASSDPQVDKLRFYRRQLASDQDFSTADGDVVDTYKFVAELDIADDYIDMSATDYLGAEIQTLNHYRIGEADDTEENRRGIILPTIATIWKGRVWVVPSNSNMIYYSKKLEEDGATGLTGDMMPDYFPPDNQIQMPTMESILRLEPLTGDQLAIYCKNGSIWLMWGCDSVLNPLPVEDYILKEMIPTTGLVASAGLGNFRGRHVYLSRKGIYGFSGSPDIEFLSENVQSIIDGINDSYITTSVLLVFGDELWCLVDDDNDGAMEDIYIFDLQKSTPAWRYYNYGVNINDIIQRQKGTSYKTLFAADASNKYILELEDGTTDNAQAIESEIETHNIKINDRVMIHDVEINGNYPGTPPSYEVNIIDNTEESHSYWLSPESETDTRGNKTGTRVISVDTIRLKMTSWSLVANELRKIRIGYVEK